MYFWPCIECFLCVFVTVATVLQFDSTLCLDFEGRTLCQGKQGGNDCVYLQYEGVLLCDCNSKYINICFCLCVYSVGQDEYCLLMKNLAEKRLSPLPLTDFTKRELV